MDELEKDEWREVFQRKMKRNTQLVDLTESFLQPDSFLESEAEQNLNDAEDAFYE